MEKEMRLQMNMHRTMLEHMKDQRALFKSDSSSVQGKADTPAQLSSAGAGLTPVEQQSDPQAATGGQTSMGGATATGTGIGTGTGTGGLGEDDGGMDWNLDSEEFDEQLFHFLTE